MNIRLSNINYLLRQSLFVRNLLTVLSGTVLAQIIGFGLSPVISRLFTPADIGIYSSFYAVIFAVSAGITLEFTQALMLPKNNEDAANLLSLSILATAFVCILFLIVMVAVPSVFIKLTKAPSTWWLVLLVVALFLSGLSQTLQAWTVRAKAFNVASTSQVVRSLSANGTQVGLGLLNGGPISLIFGSILGDVLANLNLFWLTFRNVSVLRKSIRFEQMMRLAKEYRDFPIYAASQNFVNALSLSLPVLMLAPFYGIATAGIYAFAMRILMAPVSLIQRALRPVLLQKACETQHNGGKLTPIFIKITVGTAIVGLIPAFVLIIWAPDIFSYVFGAKWRESGELARSLVLWQYVVFCNAPASLFARIIRMQHKMFIWEIILLATRALVLIYGGMYLTAFYTISIFAIVSAFINLIIIIRVGWEVSYNEKRNTIVQSREAFVES